MTNDKQRERLKEILENHCAVAECKAHSQDCTAADCASCLADHILADGWLRPPCKVGDMVWCIVKDLDEVLEGRVRRFTVYDGVMNVYCGINGYYEQVYTNDEFEKMVFPSKEEAEAKLKARGKVCKYEL